MKLKCDALLNDDLEKLVGKVVKIKSTSVSYDGEHIIIELEILKGEKHV